MLKDNVAYLHLIESITISSQKIPSWVDLLEGGKVWPRDLDMLDQWGEANGTGFNKTLHWVLHLAPTSPGSSTGWGQRAGKGPSRKGPGSAGQQRTSHEERLGELGVQPGEQEAQQDLITLCNHPKGGYSQVGVSLLSWVTSNRTRGHRLQLHQGRFRLDIKD